ncbi:MAG: hypothetical protein Q9190_004957 [Brigantiaea leucoxantha]
MSSSNEASTERTPLLKDCNGISDPEDQPKDLSSTEDNAARPLAEEPSTGRLLLVMGSIWLGCFIAAIDSTLIATLSSPISNSFNSLSLLSWLASSYFIANAALQPLSGRLTDILSRRTGLIYSNIFFAAGNLICGLAKTEIIMIFGRFIAGMGGGGMFAISTFVGSDLVPLRRRGVWQGFGNISYGVGAALGGVFGGWINDVWNWRIAFLVQVPLTVISGVAIFFTVRIPVKHTDKSAWKRIDFLGAITLSSTLILLLLGLNSGGNSVPWSHPLVLTTLPLSVVFLLLFIYVESNHASEPMIPVRLLLDRTVLSACLTNWFGTMSQFAILFYGPLYFQSVKELSAQEAGARLVPMAVGALGSVATGLIMRWTGRYYFLSVCVMAVFVAASVAISTFNVATPAWEPFVALFFAGLGYAGMLTVTLLALIAAVDHEHQAVITSASYAFRSTGSTIGITITSAVFQNVLKRDLWRKLGDREGAAEVISRLRDSVDEIKKLPPDWKSDVKGVYMDALRGVFLTTLGMVVLSFLVSLAMREHKLHKNLSRT